MTTTTMTTMSATSTRPVPTGRAAPSRSKMAALPRAIDIKGNADSMLYHVPGSRYYGATKAEVYFATVEDAESAGFAAPGAAQERYRRRRRRRRG